MRQSDLPPSLRALKGEDSSSRKHSAEATVPCGRGGVPNLVCIAEPLDALAAELAAVADRITVILPWGSLLRAVGAAELPSLRNIAHLCLPDASLDVVFSYDAQRDARQAIPLTASGFDEEHIATLPRLYQQAGFQVVGADRLPQTELAGYQTTWAKRLAFGRPRKIWRLRASWRPPLPEGP